MSNPHPLVEELAADRRRRRISLDKVAARGGIGRSSIAHWEQGVSDPGLSNFEAYAEVLGYEVILRKKRRYRRGCDV